MFQPSYHTIKRLKAEGESDDGMYSDSVKLKKYTDFRPYGEPKMTIKIPTIIQLGYHSVVSLHLLFYTTLQPHV